MQGTRVRALIWEDPTWCGATRPVSHTTEPAHLEPVLHNKRGCDSERPTHRDEEWPPLATTRESPRTETKTQHSQKKKDLVIIQKVSGFNKKGLSYWEPGGLQTKWKEAINQCQYEDYRVLRIIWQRFWRSLQKMLQWVIINTWIKWKKKKNRKHQKEKESLNSNDKK